MPLLKETRESLRAYFVFAAVLSSHAATAHRDAVTAAISSGKSSTLASVPMFVNLTFAVLFLYIALRFKKLLPKPALIKVVLAISMALAALSFAVSLRSGVQVSSVATLILSLLLSVYLLKSVARLSTEVAPRIA